MMKRYWLLYVLLAAAIILGACHKRYRPVATPPVSQAPAPTPPPAPTCTLTGEPATINAGQSVTLSWTTTDATEVTLDPGLGKQLAQGSTTASPSDSTTYTLTGTGPGGSVICTARVTVSGPALPATPSVKEENLAGQAQAAEEQAAAKQLQDVYFDFDKSDLRPDAQQILTTDAAFLKAHPDVHITIEGHCDQRGSEEYNLGLGERRADTARQYLVSLGVTADRIATVTYGKDRLFCTEASEECWQQNRRDQIVAR